MDPGIGFGLFRGCDAGRGGGLVRAPSRRRKPALLTAPWAVQAAWQLADVPLSLFMASATTLLVMGTETTDSRLLALAGFASSLAAWTKQEGLVFIATAAIALLTWDTRGLRWRALAVWTLGALPLLGLVAWFALVVALQSSLAQPVSVAVGKLVDPTRHREVVGALAGAAGPEWVVAYASAAILFAWNAGRAPAAALRAALMAALMFAGFYLVYPITRTLSAGTSKARCHVCWRKPGLSSCSP